MTSTVDTAGEAALNQLLERDPRSIEDHIGKARCRAQAGDDDIACYFYRMALALAEVRDCSDALLADVAAARYELESLQARRHSWREARLAGRGVAPETWSPRLRHSLEHAAGRRKLYAEQPTSFVYAGLPPTEFYDPGAFAWVPQLEAAADAIREELMALLAAAGDQFQPYIRSDVGSVPLAGNKPLLNSKDWSVLALCENGWLAPDLVRQCPRTWEAVLQAPVPRVAGWGPTVVFSLLKGGAHIAPHTGTHNARLICHLPLIVPPGCRFRVGSEIREWRPGKLLIFNDTIEHEAWNDSNYDRIVLIFDIWRPELTEQEQRELTALFSD